MIRMTARRRQPCPTKDLLFLVVVEPALKGLEAGYDGVPALRCVLRGMLPG